MAAVAASASTSTGTGTTTVDNKHDHQQQQRRGGGGGVVRKWLRTRRRSLLQQNRPEDQNEQDPSQHQSRTHRPQRQRRVRFALDTDTCAPHCSVHAYEAPRAEERSLIYMTEDELADISDRANALIDEYQGNPYYQKFLDIIRRSSSGSGSKGVPSATAMDEECSTASSSSSSASSVAASTTVSSVPSLLDASFQSSWSSLGSSTIGSMPTSGKAMLTTMGSTASMIASLPPSSPAQQQLSEEYFEVLEQMRGLEIHVPALNEKLTREPAVSTVVKMQHQLRSCKGKTPEEKARMLSTRSSMCSRHARSFARNIAQWDTMEANREQQQLEQEQQQQEQQRQQPQRQQPQRQQRQQQRPVAAASAIALRMMEV